MTYFIKIFDPFAKIGRFVPTNRIKEIQECSDDKYRGCKSKIITMDENVYSQETPEQIIKKIEFAEPGE